MGLLKKIQSLPEAQGDVEQQPRHRHPSTRSTGSIGYFKRTGSTATTDRPFERTPSKLSSVPSGKSFASVRTRCTSISRSEYHDDLKPELESGLNVNVTFAVFVITFGSSFLFGYNIGALNQIADLIKDFYREAYQDRYGGISERTVVILWSLTTAIFIPGGMAGAFLGGWLADKIGRKRTILFSHVFAFLGAASSCACLAAKAPEMLMLGRILFGINSGLGNCIAPMFLSEIAPFNLRGAFGTVHQLAITLGIFMSSVFGFEQILGTRENWPYVILLEALPAATSLCILPFLPETPRFLLLQRRDRDGASASLKFYRRSEDVSTDMEEMDTESDEQEGAEQKQEQEFTLKQLFAKDLRMPLFIACMLQLIQQFSGINAVFFYSGGIFAQAGVAKESIPFAVMGTNAVNVVMTIVSVLLMDKAGRRVLLLFPMFVMIIDLILITISLNLQDSFKGMAYVSIGSVIIYVICFALGLGPIPMMIGAELFRQAPRPKAMAVAGVCNWVFTFVIAMAFEPVQMVCGNYTFLIFLGFMIIFIIFTFFKVPETKNKTFEEIAHQFAPGKGIEVEEIFEDDVFDAEEIPLANDDGDEEDHNLVTLNFKPQSNDTGNDVTGNDVTATETEVKPDEKKGGIENNVDSVA